MIKVINKVLFFTIITIITMFLTFSLYHNIRNIIEKNEQAKTLGESLNIVSVKNKKMSCYVQGSGPKTIVLLSGYGTPSPIANFMPLSNELSKHYKVVTLEYFGYRFSDSTKEERSNENLVEEIRCALKDLDINPPYVLMPHSFSGIYSMYYANKYPEEVLAIIGLDDSKPNQMKNNGLYKGQWWNRLKSFIGTYRVIDWIAPSYMEDMFFKGIDKSFYNEELLNMMHRDFVWHYNTLSNINEQNMMYKNASELFNVKYLDSLPVLSVLCSKNAEKESLGWVTLHEEVISNPQIQKIKILKGRHYIHYNQIESISNLTYDFLKDLKQMM